MPKLYIIHGWTYQISHWDKTVALLKQAGIEVEMLRVPGLTAPSRKVWTISEYVAWAGQNIPDGAIALGHSNGGRILLNLLSQRPDKLSRLILLSAAGVYEKSRRRDILRFAAKMLAPLKKFPLLRKVIHKLIGASDYSHAPENMKKTLTNMLDSDKELDLTKITTPTSILWGEEDQVTPLRQGKIMHQRLKNSRLKTFKNWTHAPYICDPEGLASAIVAVLKEQK